MNRTPIEWTTFTANPLKYRDAAGNIVWACVHASPGCQHCYSEALAKRYGRGGRFNVPTMNGLTPFLDDAELHKMLTAKRVGGVDVAGSRCFVGDMTDVFGEWVSDELLDRLFAVFALRPDVTWQLLTKRAARLPVYFGQDRNARVADVVGHHFGNAAVARSLIGQNGTGYPVPNRWPLPNVHIGVSVEDQPRADERIPLLLQTPAAVRFISAEPLLGPVDLSRMGRFKRTTGALSGGAGHPDRCVCQDGPDAYPGTPHTHYAEPPHSCARCGSGNCQAYRPAVRGLDWVIVGGESGPSARPFDLAWARSIVQQCQAAGVACFVKQLGADPFDGAQQSCDARECCVHDYTRLKLADRKGGDMDEWPADLRVREFPAVLA